MARSSTSDPKRWAVQFLEGIAKPANADHRRQRQPHPTYLAAEHLDEPVPEGVETDVGDLDRSPGKEIPSVVERGEVGNSLAAVREPVEQAVRSRDDGKIAPQQPPRFRK